MTDTGQVPGEGLPESAGGHPVLPPHSAYPYADPQSVPHQGHEAQETAGYEDDMLLMPGSQGAWMDQQQPYPQQGSYPQPDPYQQHQYDQRQHQYDQQGGYEQQPAAEPLPHGAPQAGTYQPGPLDQPAAQT
ncbi:hypothetical protein E4099_30140, partial [Streptomyces palmae]